MKAYRLVFTSNVWDSGDEGKTLRYSTSIDSLKRHADAHSNIYGDVPINWREPIDSMGIHCALTTRGDSRTGYRIIPIEIEVAE